MNSIIQCITALKELVRAALNTQSVVVCFDSCREKNNILNVTNKQLLQIFRKRPPRLPL